MMAKSRMSDEVPPSMSKQEGLKALVMMKERGEKILAQNPIPEPIYDTWSNTVSTIIKDVYGSRSAHLDTFVGSQRFDLDYDPDGLQETAERAKNLERRLTVVQSLIETLDIEAILPARRDSPVTSTDNRSVFVVHGHREAPREMTARFLEKLDLKPIILHEQPNKGRTIIEKFTDSADVGFAVILFTGDDRGGIFADPYEDQKPRVRQNVMLELGFFLGKLGRNRVCVLYEDGVEIPSDYSGVIFTKLDAGGSWKFLLAKELKAAGMRVAMNKAVCL